MITDEQIRGVIDKCSWAQKFHGFAICPLLVKPCIRGVNDGQCPELQKLFLDECEKNATESLDNKED